MISRRIIEQFVELKALGKTNDEIASKTGVSKPTLIKWGKIYKSEIEKTRLLLTTKLAEKIASRNSELINIIAENLKRTESNKTASNEVKLNYIKRAYKKLGDIFKVKVKEIELRINSEGDVVRVRIYCEG